MKVDVICEFIAPILHIFPKEITFQVEKVSALAIRLLTGMLQRASGMNGGWSGSWKGRWACDQKLQTHTQSHFSLKEAQMFRS